MKYNWQLSDWPNFRCDLKSVEAAIFAFTEKTGRIGGMLDTLPETLQTETIVEMLVSEAVKTSLIEGEYLSRQDVMSSVKKNLGLAYDQSRPGDRRAAGIADLMMAVRDTFAQPLSREVLFAWHKKLMGGAGHVNAGVWRTHNEPMRVMSGIMGKEEIHFEAPPSGRVPYEMKHFINWFNKTASGEKSGINSAPVRSAVAHLYFETIHPFEDGNGRIGRALAEKALSQGIGRPVLMSLSQAIDADRKAYYTALKRGQRSNDITAWVDYFINTVLLAQDYTVEQISFTLKKSRLFDRFGEDLNERQRKVLGRMLEDGPKGFEGGMSAKKYISITGTAKSTATRDLQDLASKKIFVATGGGRSTRYSIVL